MKKFIMAVSALTALSLLISSLGFAEPTHPCEVGLYLTPDGYGATGTYVVWDPVDVYLVLTKPCDVQNENAPFANISAYDLRLTFSPIPNNDLFFMGADYPGEHIDLGQKIINQGFLEFVVGFSYDIAVIDEAVVLATLHFFNMNELPTYVTLGPPQEAPPSLPGQMCFYPGFHTLQVMHPVSGSFEAPVFIFNGEAVAVENESFGSVKALYR